MESRFGSNSSVSSDASRMRHLFLFRCKHNRVKHREHPVFQNRASLVQPGLSQYITDELTDKCKAQTNLAIVNGLGDANFEGEIIDYNTRPHTVSADANAAVNRFTIGVRVKFTNVADPEKSFEQTFSRYEDYSSLSDLSEVESQLSERIVEMLVEDIFNAAFVNW